MYTAHNVETHGREEASHLVSKDNTLKADQMMLIDASPWSMAFDDVRKKMGCSV
jgi:hypothetical protein